MCARCSPCHTNYNRESRQKAISFFSGRDKFFMRKIRTLLVFVSFLIAYHLTFFPIFSWRSLRIDLRKITSFHLYNDSMQLSLREMWTGVSNGSVASGLDEKAQQMKNGSIFCWNEMLISN